MESMKDYEKELERSFRTINEGDIVSGAVVAVTDEEVTLDLNYYAPGIIKIENLSNDTILYISQTILLLFYALADYFVSIFRFIFTI